jgi:hypothetical protein
VLGLSHGDSFSLRRDLGIVDGVLSGDVGSLATPDGWCASGIGFDGRGNWRDCRSDRLSRCAGGALTATRGSRRRRRGLGLTGALLALPPGPDPGHLIFRQPALRAQHRHVH